MLSKSDEMEDSNSLVTAVCPNCHQTIEAEAAPSVTCTFCDWNFGFCMQFGNFVLQNRLGSGGMGSVYLGRDVILKRPVAVKVLSPELARNEKFVEAFLSEAEITASLNHPNIVHVYAIGEQEGYYYLALELIDGGSLDDKLEKAGCVTELEGINIGIGVARGLQFAAQRGLIHRDIKPGNIVFGADNTPKVVDFGLSQPIASTDNLGGDIWGTPYYISPEKLECLPEDIRSDLYSLGATLFHAIAGRPPYEGETSEEVAHKHLSGNVVSLRAFVPTINGGTANAIAKAMARRPEDRHGSYEEFIKELEDAKRRVLQNLQGESPRLLRIAHTSDIAQTWTSYLVLTFIVLLVASAFWTGLSSNNSVTSNLAGYSLNSDSAKSGKNATSSHRKPPTSLPSKNGNSQPPKIVNYLINSSFEFNSNQKAINATIYDGFQEVYGWKNIGSTYIDSGVVFCHNSGYSTQDGSVIVLARNGDSGAYQITKYPMRSGDQITLTWWAKSILRKGGQVVSLLSATNDKEAFRSLTPLAVSTIDLGASGKSGKYTQYSLSYKASSADVGRYLTVAFKASPKPVGEYLVSFDNFVLQVTPKSK